MEGAPTELWRFACEGFLGNLTREHQERLAQVEAELEATVDGETIPYRMLRVAMSNEPDRDKRRALEETRVRLLDENLNPVYLDAAQIDREAVAAARRAELLRALQALRLPARRARRGVPRAARRDREAVGARGRPPLPRAARDRPLRRARLGRRRGSSARPSSTSSTRRIAMLPALEATLDRPRRSTSARRRTSTSTSRRGRRRRRARSARRSRCRAR